METRTAKAGWLPFAFGPEALIACGAATLVFAALAFNPALLNDGDTYWHIRAGEWMLSHGAVPHTDIFSYTRAGQPWATHEWLAEVLFAGAYGAAGFAGVLLLTALAIALTAAVLTRFMLQRVSAGAALAAVALGLACASGSLLARPHILAMPLLALWTCALFDARAARKPPPWALLPLMVAWANLHGGFIFGIALLAPLMLELWTETRDRALLLRWGLFGLASCAAALVTPAGIDGLLFPFQLMASKQLNFVGEWRPTDFATLQPIEIALAVGLVVLLTRGVKAPLLRVALLLGLLHMALQHQRNQLLFGVVGVIAVADMLAQAYPRAALPRLPARAAPALLAVALLLCVARVAAPAAPGNRGAYPQAALDAVPPALRLQPMFNDYAFGGALIFDGVRPYIDSRVDVFGDDFLKDYGAAMQGKRETVARIFERNHVTWTMLNPRSPLAALLDATPGWRRIYADRIAVIHVRETPPAPLRGR